MIPPYYVFCNLSVLSIYSEILDQNNEEQFHSFVLNFQIVNVDSTEALNDDELNEKINDTTMQGDVANTDEINSDKEDPGSPKVKPAMPEVNIH